VGCQGCLGLDDYVIVPATDGGAGGAGDGGGSVDTCAPSPFEGLLFVSRTTDGDAEVDLGDACPAPGDTSPGIDVLALAPQDGACLGRARVAAAAGVTFEATTSLAHAAAGGDAIVAGTFRGGALTLPTSCDGASETLDPAATSRDALFVARLRFEEGAFCTAWARLAWTDDDGAALRVRAAELGRDGTVALAGALGGRTVRFEDASDARDVSGGAFVATWSSAGTLLGVLPLASGAADDAAEGLAALGAGWLATGVTTLESPDCHDCPGETSVLDPASACPDGGGSTGGTGGSGAGGMGGSGTGGSGTGGSGGSGGSPDDLGNAFLLRPTAATCAHLETFGSDRLGLGDTQIGFGVARAEDGCPAYWTGLAGRDAWPVEATDPTTTLFATDGTTRDGFLARVSGEAVGCRDTGRGFSVRLRAAGVVAGDHVEANRCSDGAVSTALVRNAGGQSLTLNRCVAGTGCDGAPVGATLAPDAQDQLVVLGVGGAGELAWHASFGPVQADDDAGAAPVTGRPRADLALDRRDHPYVALTTTGPLRAHNVESFGCTAIEDASAPAGTWVLGLQRDGFFDRAHCRWAAHLGR
jgi:hypothetical protein